MLGRYVEGAYPNSCGREVSFPVCEMSYYEERSKTAATHPSFFAVTRRIDFSARQGFEGSPILQTCDGI